MALAIAIVQIRGWSCCQQTAWGIRVGAMRTKPRSSACVNSERDKDRREANWKAIRSCIPKHPRGGAPEERRGGMPTFVLRFTSDMGEGARNMRRADYRLELLG